MGKENKIKEINKNGVSQVIVKSVKGQSLSEREVYVINHHEIEGLLRVDVHQKGRGFKLVYHLTGLVPLCDFLLTPMSREVFAHLLQGILNVMAEIRRAHFNQHALKLEMDKTMINPVDQQLYFMYLPIQYYDSGSSLKTFLMDIIQTGSFIKEEESDYVKEYIRILNQGINFSVFELEEYVNGLSSGKVYKSTNIQCLKCGATVSAGAKFCSICGTKIADAAEKEGKIYKPGREQQKGKEGGTTLLGFSQRKYPYLICQRTAEKIVLDKEEFWIGRSSQDCDYAILDNRMIGRRHAKITKMKGKYYIEDLQSKNKTYVNGQAIEKKEIVTGTKIRLADENFVFYANTEME